jgi:hypothetical protein
MTVPAEAKFSTADRLNTPEPEPTQEEVLAEALRIVRGETMMLATKKHLVALAEANESQFRNGELAAEQREIVAIREGYKAEICGKCNTVLLAHKHFLCCQNEGCPMKDGKGSILEQLVAMDKERVTHA